MVFLSSAAVLERPLAVEDVGRNYRDHTGDDLRRDRLRFEHRQLEGLEDAGVDDESRTAHDCELDQLVMAECDVPERLGDAVDHAIDKGHNDRVYERKLRADQLTHQIISKLTVWRAAATVLATSDFACRAGRGLAGRTGMTA